MPVAPCVVVRPALSAHHIDVPQRVGCSERVCATVEWHAHRGPVERVVAVLHDRLVRAGDGIQAALHILYLDRAVIAHQRAAILRVLGLRRQRPAYRGERHAAVSGQPQIVIQQCGAILPAIQQQGRAARCSLCGSRLVEVRERVPHESEAWYETSRPWRGELCEGGQAARLQRLPSRHLACYGKRVGCVRRARRGRPERRTTAVRASHRLCRARRRHSTASTAQTNQCCCSSPVRCCCWPSAAADCTHPM